MGILAKEDSRMTNLPPSNLPLLKRTFSDIIQSERDVDQTGKTSSLICQRKTFVFFDGSCLSITEFIKDEKIDYYYYDWYSKKKSLIKFHSEEHVDKTYQTETEPFHIHAHGLIDDKRLANPTLQDLFSILQCIRMCLLVFNSYK